MDSDGDVPQSLFGVPILIGFALLQSVTAKHFSHLKSPFIHSFINSLHHDD